MLVDECNKLYGEKPGDDATACVVQHPQARADEPAVRLARATGTTDNRMMSLFFSKEGKHIVCGGTTSHHGGAIPAASSCEPSLNFVDRGYPAHG